MKGIEKKMLMRMAKTRVGGRRTYSTDKRKWQVFDFSGKRNNKK
jgi:hypothetical protein